MLQTMGQGSSSLRGEETRRGHGPQQAPEAQGDVPGRKGPRASAWPCPPPTNTTAMPSGDPSPEHLLPPCGWGQMATAASPHRTPVTGNTHRWSFGNCYSSLQSGFVLCFLLSD